MERENKERSEEMRRRMTGREEDDQHPAPADGSREWWQTRSGEIFRWGEDPVYPHQQLVSQYTFYSSALCSYFLCPTSGAFLAGPRPQAAAAGWVRQHTAALQHRLIPAVLQATAGAEPSSGNRELPSPHLIETNIKHMITWPPHYNPINADTYF